MRYPRIWTDDQGRSHFEEYEHQSQTLEYVPGFPTTIMTPRPALRVHFTRLPGGSFQDWHPSPHPHYAITLAGEFEVTVSDGEARRFRAGEVYLGQDTSGQGHQSRVVSEEEWLAAVITLADEGSA